MNDVAAIAPIRILPDDVANKIAAGEVVERPASVVKELVENALDAGATRIAVRLVAAGKHLIEVQDNGHGMSEQNALLAVERHATSKIRNAQDLDNIHSLGFRGEALASIAAVSRFVLITRRSTDESGTQLRIEGGILREVQQVGTPVGTRISVNRLYFNTPVRAKFLKGITTELNHCIDIVQRHALAHPGVAFQFIHNERVLLDIPEQAELQDRISLIWGLTFARDMIAVEGAANNLTLQGMVGKPDLNRSSRSHQFFFVNGRPVVNRSLQYGLEDAYRSLLTIGRYPVGVVIITMNPRQVDVNIHPTKREIRFRDERMAHDAVRNVVRQSLSHYRQQHEAASYPVHHESGAESEGLSTGPRSFSIRREEEPERNPLPPSPSLQSPRSVGEEAPSVQGRSGFSLESDHEWETRDLPGLERHSVRDAHPADDLSISSLAPRGFYASVDGFAGAPIQLFDTYLLVPEETRLLIIDQHALHERLNYEALLQELEDADYASQQLAVPVVFEVAPSQVQLLEENLGLFGGMGIEIEPFGGTSFQVTAVCHLYAESKTPDVVYGVLDELAQGHLFDVENVRSDLLRIATRACKASVKAGDSLSPEERRNLLDGFRRLRPPYTCPHGRPIIVELTQHQMEKSFRRIQ